MLKIRLQRKGKRNQPFFRIIVTEKKNPPRGGRALEMLGFLNPLTKEKQLKADRIKHWLSVGAQPSDRVHNLLVDEGILKDKKKPVHAKPKKKEGDESASAPPPPKATEGQGDAKAGKEETKPAEKPEEKKEDAKPEGAKEAKPEAKKEEEKPTEEKPAKEEPVPSKAEVKPAEEKPKEEKPAPTEDKKE